MSGLDKDSFLRLAREAGLPVSDKFDGIGHVWCSDEYPIDEQLQRFANLVAAAEREACAKLCDDWSKRFDDVGGYIGRNIRARGQQENG
jgi:hypothetical protein